MSSVNLVIIVEAIQTVIDHIARDESDTNVLHIPSLISVAAALGMTSTLNC